MNKAPWIAKQLKTLLNQRGHAWLLRGPAGLGQFELADELARAWLCDTPMKDEVGHITSACGQCTSCHAIDVKTHADLSILMPEVQMIERGYPISESAQKELDEKKRKPSNEVRVAAMHELIAFAQLTSARGRGKVAIIYPAEKMNAPTANALLKTLEEPVGDMRFILAANESHQLLPTIISRCQTHTMAWAKSEEAQAWLIEKGISPQDAPALLRAAGNRAGDALELSKIKLKEGETFAKYWAHFPRAIMHAQTSAIESLTLPQAVSKLQKLCFDLMLIATNAPPKYFSRQDLPERAPSLAQLGKWWKHLAGVAKTSSHPLNPALAAEFLTNYASQVLNSSNRK